MKKGLRLRALVGAPGIGIAVLAVLYVASCRPPRNGATSYAASRDKAITAFESKKTDEAIALFEEMRKEKPQDHEVASYLAQLYATRAGVDSIDLIESFYDKSDEGKAKTSPESKHVGKIIEFLPDVSGASKKDLQSAVEVYASLIEKSDDKEKAAPNLFFYKGLYMLYIAKALYIKIMQIDKLPSSHEKIKAFIAFYKTKPTKDLDTTLYDMVQLVEKLPPKFKKTITKQFSSYKPFLKYGDAKVEFDLLKLSPTYVEEKLAEIISYEIARVSADLAALLEQYGVNKDHFSSFLAALVMRGELPTQAAVKLPAIDKFVSSMGKGDSLGSLQDSSQFVDVLYSQVSAAAAAAADQGLGR